MPIRADPSHSVSPTEAPSRQRTANNQAEDPAAVSGNRASDLHLPGRRGRMNLRPLGYEPSAESHFHCGSLTNWAPSTTRSAPPALASRVIGRQACSSHYPTGLSCPVIGDRFMRFAAANGRPERLSDDGQTILKAVREDPHLGPDLLIYGAPLRNRTVDLLLTMNRRRVPDPQVDPLDQAKHELRQALASYGPAPARAVCHSICHSIWSCSPRPAIRLLTMPDCLPRSQLVREQPRQANPPNADGT